MLPDSHCWSSVVTIGANRWFLRDGLVVWFGMLACFVGLLLTTQAFFGPFPGWEQLKAATSLGLRAGAVVLCIWSIVVFWVLENRLLMRYRMGPEGVRCETVRVKKRGHDLEEVKVVSRLVNWSSLSSVVPMEKGMAVILKKGPWTVMRLFCPDRDTFVEVSKEAEGYFSSAS